MTATGTLGNRHSVDGTDEVLKAEAKKLAKWAHHDAVMVAEALLERELTPEEISKVKHALYNSKLDYLKSQEESTDPY
jgi:hypothetical protein